MATYDEIAKVAFELYKSRGDRGGDPLQDWLEAERILAQREAASKPRTRKTSPPKTEATKKRSKLQTETAQSGAKPKSRKKA